MSYADDVIDGIFCQVCGEFMSDEGAGFPTTCKACLGQDDEKEDVADWREKSTKEALIRAGFEVKPGPDKHAFTICKAGKKLADFWPYKGWFNPVGPKPKETRGFKNLMAYLKNVEQHRLPKENK